jgi:hypothetical protein
MIIETAHETEIVIGTTMITGIAITMITETEIGTGIMKCLQKNGRNVHVAVTEKGRKINRRGGPDPENVIVTSEATLKRIVTEVDSKQRKYFLSNFALIFYFFLVQLHLPARAVNLRTRLDQRTRKN